MSTVLVIPDAHAHPDFHHKRFKWLGELAYDLRPDHVVCIGDWADMPSLCSYDKGTRGYEGRRYILDIQAAHQAQELYFRPWKANKKRRPKHWMLIGNHEQRIERAASTDAMLHGTLSIRDLGYQDYGWEVVPYRGASPGVLELDGIHYAHFHPSGVMGRPIGGVRPAYNIISKYGVSCTQGHIHTLDFYHRKNVMSDVYGLVCGVYQDYEADFAGVANDMWWRGVVVKRDVEKGCYNPQFISLDSIKREYK